MGDVLEPLSKRELISLIDLEVDRVKECEAEIARLTEENRALVAFVEAYDELHFDVGPWDMADFCVVQRRRAEVDRIRTEQQEGQS